MRTTPTGIPPLLALTLCTLPLWVYGLLCGSTGHDDSHITFWQARMLLEHGELLNYNGERIEQSSSLLLLLLTAGLAWLTPLSLVDVGYLLNLSGALVALLAVWAGAKRAGFAAAWLPALLTALSPYFAYWAWSGMETTLAAAMAMLFVLAIERWLQQPAPVNGLLLAVCSLALAAVRPEMVLAGPALLFAAAVLLRRASLLAFVVPFAALALWRHDYFGQWLPNPVYTKSGDPGFTQLQRGIEYFLRLYRHPLPAIAASLAALAFAGSCLVALRRRQSSSLLLLCCLWTIIYSIFVISSGGDWMKEGRFWVPLIAPLWLAICLAWIGPWGRWLPRTVFPVLLLAYTPFFINTFNFGTPWWLHTSQRAIAGNDTSFFEMANREHLRDWLALRALQAQVRQLQPTAEKPLLLMSKQMGMVNYHLLDEFAGKLKVRDMAGLVENSLRDCPVMAQDGFDKQGLRINYRKYFERLPQAQRECGLQAPDIIYDLYGWGETVPLTVFLESQGYHIVFSQTGRVAMKPGIDITAQEMIAVRRELLPEILPATEVVDFSRLLQP